MPLMVERAGRWAAIPLDERVPPEVTAMVAEDKDLYVATAHMGVARAAAGAPQLLEGAELVGDAESLSVACVAAARCYVVTDGPRARDTDGDRYRPISVGEPDGAAVLALARDAQGAVYASRASRNRRRWRSRSTSRPAPVAPSPGGSSTASR